MAWLIIPSSAPRTSVNGVEGLGDIEEEEGSRGVGEEEGGVKEGSKEEIVRNLTVVEKCSLIKTNARVHCGGKALSKNLGKYAVEGGEEGDWAERGGSGDRQGRGFRDGYNGAEGEVGGEAV